MDSMRNVVTHGYLSITGSPMPSKPMSIIERVANVDLPMDDSKLGSEDTKKLNQNGSALLSDPAMRLHIVGETFHLGTRMHDNGLSPATLVETN